MTSYEKDLLGEWIDITDKGTVEHSQNPTVYFKEILTYKDGSETAEAFKYGYINIQYGGKNYRIHSSAIQIVTE